MLRSISSCLIRRKCSRSFHRRLLSSTSKLHQSQSELNITEVLSTPSWSVRALLPADGKATATPKISSEELHHLLRLSALPPPKDASEEARMISTLSSQLHFVEEIQKVDTTGVEPLRSLHDETAQGEKEAEIGLDALKDALGQETIRGAFHKRIRRTKAITTHQKEISGEPWDPLKHASKTVGRYFVVQGGKER